ncbi:MAG: ornithine cyclodeaminase family protein [Propionibacteriales bacterium]|nr:ornithine cyclodeaminase family protein [Propionibacteriales bacterium]
MAPSIPPSPRVFDEDLIRSSITIEDAITTARTAFTAAANEATSSPPPWHLAIRRGDGSALGEAHVKGAHLPGSRRFTIKTSTGFPGNALTGRATSGGFSTVFDAETGELEAVLLDNGYLTELRTGAAGALVNDILAPQTFAVAAVIGTGGQARHQLAGLLAVRTPQVVRVTGRDPRRAKAFVEEARTWCRVDIEYATTIEKAVRDAQCIVTVTGATSPILRAEWVGPDVHITAVGSDSPGKKELALELLIGADLVAVDDLAQSVSLGELQGIDLDDLRHPPRTIGDILNSVTPQRPTGAAVTIADLSGLGIQDTAIGERLCTSLVERDSGTASHDQSGRSGTT